MFRVTVDNTQFEQWTSTKLPQNILEIMNTLAYHTTLRLETEMGKFKRPTGKTRAALTVMQQAIRKGDTFESGVGNAEMVGADSSTPAPPNTIRDFRSWLEGELHMRGTT